MSNEEDPQDIAEVRATTEALLARAREDAEFAAQLRAEPVAVLTAAGLPEPAAAQLSGELTLVSEDVGGFMKPGPGRPGSYCRFTSDTWCIITLCEYLPWTY